MNNETLTILLQWEILPYFLLLQLLLLKRTAKTVFRACICMKILLRKRTCIDAIDAPRAFLLAVTSYPRNNTLLIMTLRGYIKSPAVNATLKAAADESRRRSSYEITRRHFIVSPSPRICATFFFFSILYL